jgi:hypothetical protein
MCHPQNYPSTPRNMRHDLVVDRGVQKSTEQRRSPRITTCTRATVTAGKRRSVKFTIDSLSISGARLVGPLALQRGDRIDITLELDNGPVAVAGEVVRVDTPDLMTDQIAVRFVDTSPTSRAAIRELVRQNLEATEELAGDEN